jgi:hypothetical protein
VAQLENALSQALSPVSAKALSAVQA